MVNRRRRNHSYIRDVIIHIHGSVPILDKILIKVQKFIFSQIRDLVAIEMTAFKSPKRNPCILRARSSKGVLTIKELSSRSHLRVVTRSSSLRPAMVMWCSKAPHTSDEHLFLSRQLPMMKSGDVKLGIINSDCSCRISETKKRKIRKSATFPSRLLPTTLKSRVNNYNITF